MCCRTLHPFCKHSNYEVRKTSTFSSRFNLFLVVRQAKRKSRITHETSSSYLFIVTAQASHFICLLRDDHFHAWIHSHMLSCFCNLCSRSVPIQVSKSCDSLLASSPSPLTESADRKLSLPIKAINLDTPMFVPDIEEIRASPVVSRRGYLNFFDDFNNGWIKKFVVSTREKQELSW